MPCLEINFAPKKIGSDRSVKISKEASDQGASSGQKPVLIQKRNQGFIRFKICFKKSQKLLINAVIDKYCGSARRNI